jgi:hypothetical protein
LKKKKKSLKNAVSLQKLTESEDKGKKQTKMEVIINNHSKELIVQDNNKYSKEIKALKKEEMSSIKHKIVLKINNRIIQEKMKQKSMKIMKNIEMLRPLLQIKIDSCNRNK